MSAFLRSLLLGLALSVVAPLANAQGDDATYTRVFITTVKSDRVAEFEDLVRERTESLEAATTGFRSVYQVLIGEQFRYLMVDFVSSASALDQPIAPGAELSPQWANRNDAAQLSQTLLIMRRYEDLRIAAEAGSERDLVRVRIRRNASGRNQDYYEWQANQLLPALREAGVTGFFTNRVVLGGSNQTWVSFASIDNLASTQTNVLAESMGERQAAQMIQRGADMLVHTEDLIVRYRADLSFNNLDN
jgi:hypothetical protein